jgi:aminoacrylate hydrolase
MTAKGQEKAMRVVEMSDGAQIVSHRQGQGDVFLLVSGLGGTAGFWSPLMQRKADQWDMISFDQRGIGQSTVGVTAVTIRQLADDCLRILDAHNVNACVMFGHSTGGVITQDLALRHPDRIKAIILSGSWLKPHPYIDALFRQRLKLLETEPEAYQAFGAMMGYAPEWLCNNWSVFEQALKTTPRTQKSVEVIRHRIHALLAFNGEDGAKQLKMPALVLGARDDAIIPTLLQEELYDSLPNAQLALLESGGHFFPITRLEETISHIDRFMGPFDA